MNCLTQGFIAMVPAMLILTFAVTLKTMTGLLGADVYVAGLMQGASAGLTNMLPAIIFLVACFLAFASGTSWGTFGILIPIVTGVFTDPTTGAIVPGAEHLIIIGVAACLAGAVMGDHCSPISDTTIMASAGAQCEERTDQEDDGRQERHQVSSCLTDGTGNKIRSAEAVGHGL